MTGAAEAAPQKARMAIAVEARIVGEKLGVEGEGEGERAVGMEGNVEEKAYEVLARICLFI